MNSSADASVPRRDPEPVAVQEPRRRRVERELRGGGDDVDRPVGEVRRARARDEEHHRRARARARPMPISTGRRSRRLRSRTRPIADRRQRTPRSRRPERAGREPGTGTRRAPAWSAVTEPGPISNSIDDAIASAATHASSTPEAHARRRRDDEPRAHAEHVERGERGVGVRAPVHAGAARDPRLRESSTARTSSTATLRPPRAAEDDRSPRWRGERTHEPPIAT